MALKEVEKGCRTSAATDVTELGAAAGGQGQCKRRPRLSVRQVQGGYGWRKRRPYMSVATAPTSKGIEGWGPGWWR
jgi:hypothetical protein